jgi:hypothetical protein
MNNIIIKIMCMLFLMFNIAVFGLGAIGGLLLDDLFVLLTFGIGTIINLIMMVLLVYDVIKRGD